MGYCLGRGGLGGAFMTSELGLDVGLDWERESWLFFPTAETLLELGQDYPLE